jgi:DNA-binding NarL/FixJ family response regulator
MPHILIVDDHKEARDNLRALFKTQQPYWELSEAESGKQALEMFRKAQFEVVILDIVMEEMSGIEAAYETQKIAPDTKIVIISSRYTARDASVVARLLGVNAFVDKAQAAETLIPEIKRLLAV